MLARDQFAIANLLVSVRSMIRKDVSLQTDGRSLKKYARCTSWGNRINNLADYPRWAKIAKPWDTVGYIVYSWSSWIRQRDGAYWLLDGSSSSSGGGNICNRSMMHIPGRAVSQRIGLVADRSLPSRPLQLAQAYTLQRPLLGERCSGRLPTELSFLPPPTVALSSVWRCPLWNVRCRSSSVISALVPVILGLHVAAAWCRCDVVDISCVTFTGVWSQFVVSCTTSLDCQPHSCSGGI